MPLFSPADATFLEAVRRVAFANPFLPDRIELEREALGDDFQLFSPQVWSRRADADNHQQNLQLLATRAAAIVDSARAALVDGQRGSNKELSLYEDVVLYVLYDRFRPQLQATIEPALEGTVPPKLSFGPTSSERSSITGARRSVAAEQLRAGAHLRRLLPGPPRVSPHFRLHRRPVAAGGSRPRCRLAIDFHARHAPLSPLAVQPHERNRDAHLRPFRHRQGAGGTRRGLVALHPVRREKSLLHRRLSRLISRRQYLGSLAQPHRIGIVRPCEGLIHGRHSRPRGLARAMQAARHGVHGRNRRAGPVDPGQDAARGAIAARFRALAKRRIDRFTAS